MIASHRNVTNAALYLLESGMSVSAVASAVSDLLARSRLQAIFPGVITELDRRLVQSREQEKVKLLVARPSDAEDRLVARMAEYIAGSSTVEYSVSIDPDLVGGFVARHKSTCHDYSIRNSLVQLEHHYKSN